MSVASMTRTSSGEKHQRVKNEMNGAFSRHNIKALKAKIRDHALKVSPTIFIDELPPSYQESLWRDGKGIT
jgi:hypothetical protein